MITFREQVILVIYFLLYGMFLGIAYDLLQFYLSKLKIRLIWSYLFQLVFWCGLVIISCLYILKVSGGYLTIYTFAFFFFGVVIYLYLLREKHQNNLKLITRNSLKIYRKTKKYLILAIYPQEVVDFILKIIKAFKKQLSKLFIKIKRRFNKRKQGENNEPKVEENNNIDSNLSISRID